MSLAIFLLVAAIALPSDVYPHDKVLEQRIQLLTVDKQFSIVAWEISALADKAWGLIRGTDVQHTDTHIVREFFDVTGQIGRLRGEAERCVFTTDKDLGDSTDEYVTELLQTYG